jgi:hypothetical protein
MVIKGILGNWSLGRTLLAAAAIALLAASGAVFVAKNEAADTPDTFDFGLWGDEPYARTGDAPRIPALASDMNNANLAFTVFDGDTKDGSSVCTDDLIINQARDRFNSLVAPTIYVVGDNEWTDCHRTNNGNYNSIERLNTIRKNMFGSAESFGQNKMILEHQGALGGPFSENTRWVYGNVVFVGLSIPGSNNNKINGPEACTGGGNTKRTQAECDADNVEYEQRDAMNLQWLRRSFDLAKSLNSPAIMIVIQADLGFDLPETATNEFTDGSRLKDSPDAFDGYSNFLNLLIEQTKAFKGQVVLVHGDTHFFKVDKPLLDQSHLIKNFTRVETFGSGNPHWVKATVNPKSRNVFTFEPMIVPGN